MVKILILDCITRKGLTVSRALGVNGIQVHCAGHKSINPARFSRFSKKFFLLPNPENKKEEFQKSLLKLLKNENYSLIIPLEEGTIKAIYPIEKEVRGLTNYISTPEKIFDSANDKFKTLTIAKNLKIPIPKSYCPKTESDLKMISKKIGYPLIIKPKISSGSRGIMKVNNGSELIEKYSKVSKKYPSPIVQEFIPSDGKGVLAGFLLKKGKVIADFSYERLREYPLSGGPGTMWLSNDNIEVKEYGKRLLEKLNWNGIAMVEFKLDKKIPKLMEINPRFWGSLALAIGSGVNFPYLLYLLSQNKKIEKPKCVLNMKCRWLIPGDLMHFISNPNRFCLKPSFFKFFEKNTFYDELSLKDIPGSIGSIIFAFFNLFDIEIWRKAIFRK